jgi:hypothetical protein
MYTYECTNIFVYLVETSTYRQITVITIYQCNRKIASCATFHFLKSSYTVGKIHLCWNDEMAFLSLFQVHLELRVHLLILETGKWKFYAGSVSTSCFPKKTRSDKCLEWVVIFKEPFKYQG